MNNINISKIAVSIILLISMLLFLSSCTSNPTMRNLQSVEVDDYKGPKFDDLSAFRDNSIKGPQYVDTENYMLEVLGLVETPLSLSYDEVLAYQSYTKPVILHCVEGWDASVLWEGVLLKDIFADAVIADGANTVIFYAYDNYSSSLPLDYIIENNIMIAYKINNQTLPPENGFPFQLVAEDKWGYKWVKWITRIELSNDPEYKGYWERVGYNNNGDFSGPKFER